jgi:hypothetical protein
MLATFSFGSHRPIARRRFGRCAPQRPRCAKGAICGRRASGKRICPSASCLCTRIRRRTSFPSPASPPPLRAHPSVSRRCSRDREHWLRTKYLERAYVALFSGWLQVLEAPRVQAAFDSLTGIRFYGTVSRRGVITLYPNPDSVRRLESGSVFLCRERSWVRGAGPHVDTNGQHRRQGRRRIAAVGPHRHG